MFTQKQKRLIEGKLNQINSALTNAAVLPAVQHEDEMFNYEEQMPPSKYPPIAITWKSMKISPWLESYEEYLLWEGAILFGLNLQDEKGNIFIWR